jgi:hypothetical protein
MMRSSPKIYGARSAAACQSARLAWDILTNDGEREVISMMLLDGWWSAVSVGGEILFVEADWIAAQTRRSLSRLSLALDRRAAQGRA